MRRKAEVIARVQTGAHNLNTSYLNEPGVVQRQGFHPFLDALLDLGLLQRQDRPLFLKLFFHQTEMFRGLESGFEVYNSRKRQIAAAFIEGLTT